MRTGAQPAAAYPVRPRTTSSFSNIVTVTLILHAVFASAAVNETHSTGQNQNQSQSEILRKFKTALINADAVLSDWNATAKDPCAAVGNWNGVHCMNGHVWGLRLENMNLKGKIDVEALMPLKFLRKMSFRNNSFEGPMPNWRKLGALKSLYLSNNKFSGDVSHEAFKGMTSLKKVHLAHNKFSGPIPASLESPRLIELRLEFNQFTGRIPDISSEHLVSLNVSNNQLEGPIPQHLSKLDYSSFSGNKELCGKPLEACDPSMYPSLSEIAETATDKKLSPAKIAMMAAAAVFCLVLIVLLVVVLLRGKKKSSPRREEASVNEEESKSSTVVAAPSVIGAKQTNQAGKLTFIREDRENKFDLQDLMRASAEVLGSGNFGASYKAVLVDGEAMVVKRFKMMNNVAREDFHEHMRRLGRLKHPNLLPLVAYLYRKEEKLLVFNHIANASLSKHLHAKHSDKDPGLTWANRLKIIKGVSKGLLYLHNELPSLTVPHAHLKSSNVLLDNKFNPLLMDYTLSPVVNPTQLHNVLVAYKSPDYANTYKVSKKTDVWCLGILILETLTGKFVIAQGCGNQGADLAGWISAIVADVWKNVKEAFDKEMPLESEKSRPEMEKLLEIGIECCLEDVEKRLEMEEAVKKIEKVQLESN